MNLSKNRYRIQNFFYGLIQKRQLDYWEKLPSSNMRLYMLLIQNGNSMSRHELTEKIVEINLSANRQAAKQAINRALNNHVLVENGNQLSVREPISFVIRFGSILDGWRILALPFIIATICTVLIHPIVALFFATLTGIIIILTFLFDWLYTVRY